MLDEELDLLFMLCVYIDSDAHYFLCMLWFLRQCHVKFLVTTDVEERKEGERKRCFTRQPSCALEY